MRVVDSTTHPAGFDDDNHGANLDTTDDYKYDTNGNLTSDENKGISSIIYNHLNLPVEIIFSGTNRNIIYLYDATGRKVRKVVSDGTTVTQTDYLGGFQYEKVDAGDVELKFFMHAEGYVNNTVVDDVNVYNYVYNYTDHLGNIRLTYTWDSKDNVPKIMEENHYYPFGYKHAKYNAATWDYVQDDSGEYNLGVVLKSDTELAYKYKYNGKEFQDELGLNMYDYGARNYDPALGRWMNMDPKAEKYYNFTPYAYVGNMPTIAIDPNGKEIIVPNKDQRASVLKMINTKARGTFAFDSNGKLYLAKKEGKSGHSEYYRDKLIEGMNSDKKIEIGVVTGEKVKLPSLDKDGKSLIKEGGKEIYIDKGPDGKGAGGGTTSGALQGDQMVFVSSNENKDLKDTNGNPLSDKPADMLMHELVGHAIPKVLGNGEEKGNAVVEENKVRAEYPEGENQQREAEPNHLKCRACPQ